MRRWPLALLLASVLEACGGAKPAGLQTSADSMRFDTTADKRAAFGQAYEWFRRGDSARALPVFTALAANDPDLGDYHLYFSGVIQTRLSQYDAAQSAFSRLLLDYPQSVKAPAAGLELGKLLVRADRTDQARPWLHTALASSDTLIEEGARLALAQIDERNGAVTNAHAGYMTVRRAMSGTALGREAKQHVLALRAQHPELAPSGSAALDDVHLLLSEHDYAAAKTAAEQLSTRAAAEGIDSADLGRVVADALQGLGQTERAAASLRVLAEHYPDSPQAPEALFRLGSIQWNRDQDAAALDTFEELGRQYPHHARAAEALYASARIRQQAGESAAAIRTFADVAHRYPQSKVAAEAHWRIGWIHYLSGDWPAATTAFAQLAERSAGRDRAEAMYWQARAQDRAERPMFAKHLYDAIVADDPKGYYAMWAQQRLGGPGLGAAQNVPATPEVPAPGAAPINEAFHLTRWEALKAAGVYTLARGELTAIERTHRDDRAATRFLLQAYQTVDGYAAALRLLRRLGDGANLSSSENERLMYPLAFWTNVRHEAQSRGVDPLLVEAVMRQESMFDPEARSPADARGLLQLLPSTAARMANSGDQGFEGNDLMQPELNIQLGVRYLHNLLDRFHGDMFKAVAAYNGGEAAVEKWERQFSAADTDEFVESITYRETRDYVKRVVANYRAYQGLYATP